MTREEAERECARLATEHPDRETHQWHPREDADGDWSVVRIAVPPPDLDRTAEVLAEEKPSTPDDPRSPFEQHGGPFIGPV